MRRFDDHVTGGVDERRFPARCRTPQQEHHRAGLGGDRGDDVVGERLPAATLMRSRGSLAHGESGVQQQHSLTCPMLEVAVRRDGATEVVAQFLVHVAQRRWHGNTASHGEAQTVGLPRAVIRILTENDHSRVGQRGEIEGGEHLVGGWEDGSPFAFLPDEALQFGPIRSIELVAQHGVPISRRHGLHCCRRSTRHRHRRCRHRSSRPSCRSRRRSRP